MYHNEINTCLLKGSFKSKLQHLNNNILYQLKAVFSNCGVFSSCKRTEKNAFLMYIAVV